MKTLRVTNGTKYGPCKGGTPDGCWRDFTDGEYGDIIAATLYYHNSSDIVAESVSLGLRKASLTPKKMHTLYGGILINGNIAEIDSAQVFLSEPGILEFIPGSIRWFPNQSVDGIPLKNENLIFSNYGFPVGDITSSWGSQGTIVIQYVVK